VSTEAPLPVVVVGAGIIGACTALRLARDGRRVVLVDRLDPGEGCSFGNAGALSPAAVVPMALPGMLGKVPGWLRDPDGPLVVRPRYALRAAPWLLRWVRASRAAVVLQASDALNALNRGTLDGYRDLLDAAQFADLVRLGGHLYAFRSRPTAAGDVLAQTLRERHGVRTQSLDAGELREAEPALSPDYAAGLLLPDNGQTVNPHRLVRTLVDNLVAAGGRVLRDEVRRVAADAGRVEVVTASSRMPAAAVVLAAGAWSRTLLRDLHADVPLESERGYHLMLQDASSGPRRPTMLADRKFFATPMEHGLRLAGTVEFAGLDAPADWTRAEALMRHAQAAFPSLRATQWTRWLGHRPSLPDSVPVIDRLPVPGVFVAFGHGHLGMSGGPGTARLVADLVAGRRPFIDPAPYRHDRFGPRRGTRRPAHPAQEVRPLVR
jgi:glycine/D-amino acid oxidase-like deaminating enzyme